MLKKLALLVCLCAPAFAATRIMDTLYDARGQRASGTLFLDWPNFTAPTGVQVSAGRRSYSIVNGVLDISLEPTPSGVTYTAQFSLVGSSALGFESWSVPNTSSVVNLAAVRTSAGTVGPLTPNRAVKTDANGQLTPVTGTSTDCVKVDGSSGPCATGSGAGVSSLGGQTGSTQTFGAGTAGTSPAIASAGNVHTLNVPLASTNGVTNGGLSNTDYIALMAKVAATRQVIAGTGLSGGGDLSADRTLTVQFGATSTTVAAGNHNHDTAYQALSSKLTQIAALNCATNEIPKWNGTAWACAADQTGAGGSGITSLNGLTVSTQTFATPGTSGTAPNWSSTGSAHTLNIPMAATAAVTAGLLSKTDYDAMMAKESALTFSGPLSRSGNTISIPAATSSVAGHLTPGDWAVFNAKVSATRQILCGNGITGCGDFSADRTIAVQFGSTSTTVAAGNHTHSDIITAARGGLGANASAFSGVLKIASGVGSVVTGTSTDCVKVDGTSGACGGTTSMPVNAQTGTTYTIAVGDLGKLVTVSNASSVAVTIPAAATAGANFFAVVKNIGTSTATLTSATSALNGTVGGSVALLSGYSVTLHTDGSSWWTTGYTRINFGSGFSAAARNPVTGEIDVAATQDSVLVPYTNDGSTGTTQYRLAKLTASGTAVIVSTSDTGGALGVAESNAGTSGTVMVRQMGRILLRSEGNTTAGQYIGISATTAGTGTSSSTCPTGQVIGIWEQTGTGAADRYAVIAPGICQSGGSGSAATSAQLFTATGTYTPATGVTRVRVRALAGGGGGARGGFGQPGEGGGGGGFAEGICTVTPGSGVTVTVGAAGAPGNSANGSSGGAGGNSSFGTCVVANGGKGADHAGAKPGIGGTNAMSPLFLYIPLAALTDDAADKQVQTGSTYHLGVFGSAGACTDHGKSFFPFHSWHGGVGARTRNTDGAGCVGGDGPMGGGGGGGGGRAATNAGGAGGSSLGGFGGSGGTGGTYGAAGSSAGANTGGGGGGGGDGASFNDGGSGGSGKVEVIAL